MKHLASLTTTAEALRCVFLSSSTLKRPRCLHLRKFPQYRHQSESTNVIWRPSGFSTPRTPTSHLRDGSTIRFGPKVSHDGPTRDEQISSPMIRLVQSDKSISPPTSLQSILSSMNRRTHFLQQVSPPSASIPHPVCKIIDKAAAKAAEKERAKQLRSTGTGTKRVEIAWGIDKHDLEHKLTKMADICAEGRRVEVVLGGARRKGWNKKKGVEGDAGMEIIEKIREGIRQVDGGKEWRASEGEVGKMYTLFVEGKRKERVKAKE